ncbi:hypothetical protein [Candidatus Berkiella aquae]|uniref:Uncharacterized protein n=1 Tax=Candidatus Berkiella aquae TaxID=295108 RepID=A0A0Q9YY78_9GAMM|nr:hypothetical protein [Candidatus Berkiella aquae]MCS5711220.1 hypothetical protein [Candidatus Berkiella aquae]
MKKGPTSTLNSNGLFDVIFTGLKLNGLNIASLGLLSQVSNFYRKRLEQQELIWNAFLPEDERGTLALNPKDKVKIHTAVENLGYEIPCAQPTSTQEWEQVKAPARIIKTILSDLYPRVGPDLLDYVRTLCEPYSKEIHDLQCWLEALQALYNSANDESYHFHGLFLNNHNFARRAHQLAKATSLSFSTMALEVCSECRFSSLTMSSVQLDDFFKQLEAFFKGHNYQLGMRKEPITHEEIKTFIKKTFYPKSLLWRSKTITPPLSPEGSSPQSAPATEENSLSPSPFN